MNAAHLKLCGRPTSAAWEELQECLRRGMIVVDEDALTLGDDQTAFNAMGINPGYYYNGYLSYATVVTEVDAIRPIITRIQWQSGGGHMMVIYGYDKSQNWVYWGNPWPSSARYNWGTWSYYVSNNSFFWTHSLYRIGA